VVFGHHERERYEPLLPTGRIDRHHCLRTRSGAF
jgi:hypothetical protein